MTPEQATALRKPFPRESIGKLPKGGTMLDYVGHAAVTDRLLTVDPSWTWEPFSLTPEGLPALDRANNLWIKLTICGVTRIGVGDGKNAKETIGDAIRNAAMRFGVALDLWAKEDLVEFAQAARTHQRPTSPDTSPLLDTSGKLAKHMYALLQEAGVDKDGAHAYMSDVVGRPVESSKDLTDADATRIIAALRADLDGAKAPA